MENVSTSLKEIMAIKIVVQNMIAIMSDENQEILKNLTDSMTDAMISSDAKLSNHFIDIKNSAMGMINVATTKPEN
ncbi:hypothetical protein V2154_13165 [Ewingella sp. CoE-038-23]|uniref:hypothetical protein n=1 Tax=Ewingella docleensis TaxID=3118588 RepID=UPI0033655B0C